MRSGSRQITEDSLRNDNIHHRKKSPNKHCCRIGYCEETLRRNVVKILGVASTAVFEHHSYWLRVQGLRFDSRQEQKYSLRYHVHTVSGIDQSS